MISRCSRFSCQPPAHELGGQPVEQLGVRRRRRRACRSRSASATMPAAEVVLPDAVDHHAGRQRVVRRRDPVGQHRAPAAASSRPCGGSGSSGRAAPSTCGKPGLDLRCPGACGLPRIRTCVGGGCAVAVVHRQGQLAGAAVGFFCSASQLASAAARTRAFCSGVEELRHLRARPAAGPAPSAARWSSAGIFLIASSSIAVICRRRARRCCASRCFSSASYVARFSGGVMSVRLVVDRDVAGVAVRADVAEEREQPVVVRLRDRVDLVVVAAGAVRASGRGTPAPVVATMSSSSSKRRLQRVGRLVVPECRGGRSRWR